MALAAALIAAALFFFNDPPTTEIYTQQPLVTERLYQHLRFEPDGTGRRDLHVRVRAQTEAGVQALGEITYSYNSAEETLDIDSVVVRKTGGATVTAGPGPGPNGTDPPGRGAR